MNLGALFSHLSSYLLKPTPSLYVDLMDTIGPSRVRSMGGKWYVLIFVDDYSRYSWAFFLEGKNEVFEHFQSLALRWNNEHPNCLKAIHIDNGTEFRNASFDQFYLEHGVDQ
jgi:transposase InsO family protein